MVADVRARVVEQKERCEKDTEAGFWREFWRGCRSACSTHRAFLFNKRETCNQTVGRWEGTCAKSQKRANEWETIPTRISADSGAPYTDQNKFIQKCPREKLEKPRARAGRPPSPPGEREGRNPTPTLTLDTSTRLVFLLWFQLASVLSVSCSLFLSSSLSLWLLVTVADMLL